MENNNNDFNTKLKKISKDLVQSFFNNNDTSAKNKKINSNQNESSPIRNQNFSFTEILLQKKKNNPPTTVEKYNNKNKNSITNSYNRLLFTEQTTKSSMTNNYFPQKTENVTTKTKTNNEAKTTRFKYSLNFNKTFSTSSTYTNFKAKQESTKEKKLYEEKIQTLRNHINALKKQQSDLDKKALKAKENEKIKLKIKKNKESIKQALLSAEIDRRNEMEIKKKNIAEKKSKENKDLLLSKDKTKKNKMNDYKKALNLKQKFEQIMFEDNCKLNEFNKTLIDKIKTDREKNKYILNKKKTSYLNKLNNSYRITYQNNLHYTKKLKNELSKLEQMEDECLQKMKYTKEFLEKNNIEYTPIKSCEKLKLLANRDKIENNNINISRRKAISMAKRYTKNNKNNKRKDKKDINGSVSKIKYY